MSGRTAPAPRVLVVIPARYDSNRLPGKALADLGGKPLIVRVADNAARIRSAMAVVVATDDRRIFEAVTAAGHACVMTGVHPTGTDRVGEVARAYEADLVLNLQGDEPLLEARVPEALVDFMTSCPQADLGTCAHPFADPAQWADPNVVKVVTDRWNMALYFSRAPIPGTFPGREPDGHLVALRHVGLYAFRRGILPRFLALDRTPLEKAEGLEQLRALENGLRIGVVTIDQAPVGVDTPADLEMVRRLWRDRGRA